MTHIAADIAAAVSRGIVAISYAIGRLIGVGFALCVLALALVAMGVR